MAKSTVNESETRSRNKEERDRDRQSRNNRSSDNGLAGWFAESALRIGLAIIGVFLLLAALGQLSGLNLFTIGADILNSSVGRWLIVTVIGVALIIAAVHGFSDMGSE